MRKTTRTFLVAVTALAVTAVSMTGAVALAASPKLPANFSGGYQGAPLSFKLNKQGKATYAFVAFACKTVSGEAAAISKHPSGTVKHGKLTLTFTDKLETIGTVDIKFVVTFPSAKSAKGTAYISNAKCKPYAPKFKFTATS